MLLEGLHDNLLSGWVHGTSDGSNELIVRDGATGINIEVVEEGLLLWLGESETVFGKSLAELILVKGLGVVVIHDLELSLETDDTSSSSGGKLVLKGKSELLWVLSVGGGGSSAWSSRLATGG